MTSYADLVMAAIPVGFVGITASLVLLGASTVVAVPAGSLAVIAIMIHAFFVNPPRSDSSPLGRTPEPEIETPTESPDRGPTELA